MRLIIISLCLSFFFVAVSRAEIVYGKNGVMYWREGWVKIGGEPLYTEEEYKWLINTPVERRKQMALIYQLIEAMNFTPAERQLLKWQLDRIE